MSLRSRVVPCSIPSHVSTCAIFTHSQTSHVTYHVISFAPSISHVMSHMTNPNAWLLMSTFPLWFANMLTGLGRLPNWIACSLSYLGITPVRNSRTWTTERHGDLTVTIIMTSPCIAAGWRASNGGSIKKFSEPGKDQICTKRLFCLPLSFHCFTVMQPKVPISLPLLAPPLFIQMLGESDIVNTSSSQLRAVNSSANGELIVQRRSAEVWRPCISDQRRPLPCF